MENVNEKKRPWLYSTLNKPIEKISFVLAIVVGILWFFVAFATIDTVIREDLSLNGPRVALLTYAIAMRLIGCSVIIRWCHKRFKWIREQRQESDPERLTAKILRASTIAIGVWSVTTIAAPFLVGHSFWPLLLTTVSTIVLTLIGALATILKIDSCADKITNKLRESDKS